VSTVLSSRLPGAQRRAAANCLAMDIAHAAALLEQLEADDVGAHYQLSEVVPGYLRVTWATLLQDHGYNKEYRAAVAAYQHRRNYEKTVPELTAVMSTWADPNGSLAARFEAGIAARRIWEDVYTKTRLPNEYLGRLTTKCGSRPPSKQLQTVLDAYVQQLTTAAQTTGTAADNLAAAAFAKLRQLRDRVDTRYPGLQPPNHCFHLGLTWPTIPDWKELVSRFVNAPTTWDLNLPPEVVPAEFVYDAAQVLHSGSGATRTDAQGLQAYLNASPGLRALTPDLLQTAVAWFAANGERLPIDRWLTASTESTP